MRTQIQKLRGFPSAAGLALALACFAFPAMGQNCGSFATVNGACQRYATFPWFTAGGGWQSQIPVLLPSSASGGVTFRFGIGTGNNGGLTSQGALNALYGGTAGNYTFFSTQTFGVSPGQAARFDIITGANCAASCAQIGGLTVGALWVQISGPDAASLQAATFQLIYLSAPSPGAANTWQVAVPPVYNDIAATKWETTFSETPLDKKNSAANPNNMAFALTNLSTQPQTITVSLYDQFGTLLAQKNTASLSAATLTGGDVMPGGVFADTIADFFGLTTSTVTNPSAVSVLSTTGTIDGTIIFTAQNGPIAPLVVRSAGASNSPMLVTALH